MDDPVTVRTAVHTDAARLTALTGVLGYPVSESVLAERLAQVLNRSDNVLLVAEARGGQVVGWAHGGERKLLEAPPLCEILGLVVDPEYRRLGIARRLVGAIEAWAISRGINEMAVRSNVVRPESHPFYEELGYARIKTQHVYRKPLIGVRPRA